MTTVRLKNAKLAFAVKFTVSGGEEITFADDKKHHITLHNDLLITLKCRRTGSVVQTSVFNAPYWTVHEEQDDDSAAPPDADNGADAAAPSDEPPRPSRGARNGQAKPPAAADPLS